MNLIGISIGVRMDSLGLIISGDNKERGEFSIVIEIKTWSRIPHTIIIEI